MLIASKQYDFCVNNLLLAAALIFSNVRYGTLRITLSQRPQPTHRLGERTLLGKKRLVGDQQGREGLDIILMRIYW